MARWKELAELFQDPSLALPDNEDSICFHNRSILTKTVSTLSRESGVKNS